MRKKLVIYCEQCGGPEGSAQAFLLFHCLTFCSLDCRDDYRTSDEARRDTKPAAPKRARAA